MNTVSIAESVSQLQVENNQAILHLMRRKADEQAMANVLADYVTRKSPITIFRHANDIRTFAQYLSRIPATGKVLAREFEAFADQLEAGYSDLGIWASISWGIVEAYREWMLKAGYAVGTINIKLSVIRTYAKLAMKAGLMSADDCMRIQAVAGYSSKESQRIDSRRKQTRKSTKKAEPVPLTAEQAALLKQQPDTPIGRRDALLMCLLLDHGLRVGEVAQLRVEDIDLRAGLMRVRRPKVSKVQTLRMSADTRKAMERWLELEARDEGALLYSYQGKPLTTRTATGRVRFLGERIGVQSLSAHDCRHYWTTKAVRDGIPLTTIKEAGGWSSLNMLDHYTRPSRIANEGMV